MDLTDFNFILFISNYVIPDQSSVFYTSCKLECAFMTDYRGHQSFFYHTDTMACLTVPEKLYTTQNLVYDNGFQYWMSNVISSCEDIKKCNPSYVDGEYWLYPAIYNNSRVKIYCHGLSSSQPKEFVTLHYLNKVITPHGVYSGPATNCYINENRLHGTHQGETEWEKIRLDIKSGIIQADHTFTIQTSGIPKPYGGVLACSNIVHYLSCPKRGYGLVDVRDTGFKLSLSSTWKTGGYNGYCDIIERTNYRFEGKGDGHCGGCYLDGNISLELDSATVTVNCGTARGNNPVVNILTDVAISARARCYGGDQTFTTTDKVHYTLSGTLTSAKKTCRWHKRTGSYTYAVDVLVRYGEVGSLILTKDKIRTVVCTYDQYGKDASPQHQILNNFIAPRELGTIVGSIVPSNQLKLSIQDVHNKDVKGDMNIDRKYTIYGQYSGPSKGVGLKPVHCDAVSPSGKRYAILRAGCGDGLVFRKSDGFTTTGKTFRSPYFEGYHLDDSKSLSVECNVTLCTNCAGSSCATVCNGPPTYPVANGRRGTCVGGYNYKSTCTYVCNPGYGKKFAGISTCGPDGLWTVPQITCVAQGCGTPPAITYGSRTFRLTYYPNYATYKCNAGYNLIGSGIVRCLTSGKWAARPFCRVKNCGTPPGITYGARSYRFTTYRNIATYRCNPGYYLVRSARVQCLSNGKWGTRPYCRARNCGTVPNISNGRRTYRSTYYPNYATYTCNAGYNTIGSRTVRCLTNGKWAARPSCRAKNCGTPPGITYGSRIARSTYYPNAATYSCRSGYDLIGSRTVRCLTTGKWANRPYCRAKRCGVPPSISNGARSFSRTYYPNYATYRCNAGYNMVRSSRVYCLSNGKWGTRPSCSPKNCGSVPTISNGTRIAKSTLYPSIAIYRCTRGYKMIGSSAVRCLASGKWATRPVCSICGAPPTMRNGARTYTKAFPGNYATYRCNSGYNLIRPARVYCLQNGLWASNRPYCSPKNCGYPSGISYGSRVYKSTYFPNAATYSCRSGYSLIGSRIVKCLATGKWAKRPYCKVKNCGTPPGISNGARSYRFTTYPNIATYRCNSGYYLVRSAVVQCLSNGKWGTRPYCRARNCGRVPTIINGVGTARSTYYPNAATYTCKKGTTMQRGSKTVRCLANGKWAARPRCVVTSCAQLKVCNRAYRDGEYWIYTPKFDRVNVYCYGLRTSQPQEFVTFRYRNRVIRQSNVYTSIKCTLNNNTDGQAGVTDWFKVRLNITSGTLIQDARFRRQYSGKPSPYGIAVGCANAKTFNCSPRAYTKVDFTSTGFMLNPKQVWVAKGTKAVCRTRRRTAHIYEGIGDGNCGGCYPNGGINLAVDKTAAKKIYATQARCR